MIAGVLSVVFAYLAVNSFSERKEIVPAPKEYILAYPDGEQYQHFHDTEKVIPPNYMLGSIFAILAVSSWFVAIGILGYFEQSKIPPSY